MSKNKFSLSALNGKRLLPFTWYGGKFNHLKWLLPLLPKCDTYCEPFAGSASVLLNREPSLIEIYNDLDREVVNFFSVCRDDVENLKRLIKMTPYSREEFTIACTLDPDITTLERARRFYVRAKQVRDGISQTEYGSKWSYSISTSRNEKASGVSKFFNAVNEFSAISERLLRVQIENRPAIHVIQKFDTTNTLFYCDPPYVISTRSAGKQYKYEMTDNEHKELAEILNSVCGMVAISNYDNSLMDQLYPPNKWKKHVCAPQKAAANTERIEVLWMNYNPKILIPKSAFF